MNGKIILVLVGLILLISIAGAVSVKTPTVCCEKDINGLYCQQTTEEKCLSTSMKAPTSCDSTSYCKPGICYSNKEGNCMENTPKVVCNSQNSTWKAERGPECELGCCLLGDQAAFVSLVRCKRLSSFLGLTTNYKPTIKSETECVLQTVNQDKGACVYVSEFENSCKFTTRQDCSTNIKGTFFRNNLCTNPDLNTTCEKTTQTTCVDGKEDVYYLDSCGNTANVYDSEKYTDSNYWKDYVTDEGKLCKGASGSANCGNCNYIGGSICRQRTSSDKKPTYGNNICKDLNCKDEEKLHGESWCEYTDAGKVNVGKNSVGSRYYKYVCQNGEVTVEPCADFRQEECLQDSINLSSANEFGNAYFTQAACRVNRWQDCTSQNTSKSCTNTDKRDCIWKSYSTGTICLPKNPPGRQFWNSEEASTACAAASSTCTVKYEKGLFGGGKKCIENCQCDSNSNWLEERKEICAAMGDCGSNVNWVSQNGYTDGYSYTFN